MITLIEAASMNNVIGNIVEIPWRLSNDFKRFKELTSGHDIIIGRKTFDSLPGCLPNRRHIVISRTKLETASMNNVIYVTSIEEAFDLTSALKMSTRVFVIGGGEIYEQTMQFADKIELTRVHSEFVGDAFFPTIDLSKFKLTNIDNRIADDIHSIDYSFQTFTRKNALDTIRENLTKSIDSDILKDLK